MTALLAIPLCRAFVASRQKVRLSIVVWLRTGWKAWPRGIDVKEWRERSRRQAGVNCALALKRHAATFCPIEARNFSLLALTVVEAAFDYFTSGDLSVLGQIAIFSGSRQKSGNYSIQLRSWNCTKFEGRSI
jgi:hypothetical protein